MANEMDYLNMSDEEWAATGSSNPPVPVAEPEVEDADDSSIQAEAGTEPEAEAAEPEVATDGEASAEPEGADEGEAAEADKEEAESEEQAPAQEEPDYRAVYEKLTKPFKANGREIQVKDVDDAISLMQMGANYNKKMAALRPHLKLMKLLESNGLMSEEKISYLIDLQSKNPAAISRLLKDSGVDPMDLDESKAEEYRPTVRKVDDREIELDQVLEEIQDSPTYSKTLNVVAQQWDAASKQVIANSPQLLKVINSHMESGIYDQIQAELENERMFGRLSGVSDIEAYKQIGDAIQARGGFNHIRPNVTTAPPKQVVTPPKSVPVDTQKIKDKKRAASTTVATPTPAAKEFNPLALSDDEFSKLIKPGYM